jgi:hypothetical protein
LVVVPWLAGNWVVPKAGIAGSGRSAIGSTAVDGLDILRLRN